eukprot:gb/GECG01009849.1/.p1 GENE.gb/GECG01009849.1/~~gb/GECG01009849.1/.p1  ORF type:complete len:106 (+),score=4.07 gb/GECG01009849.1/:1-318(+)
MVGVRRFHRSLVETSFLGDGPDTGHSVLGQPYHTLMQRQPHCKNNHGTPVTPSFASTFILSNNLLIKSSKPSGSAIHLDRGNIFLTPLAELYSTKLRSFDQPPRR